jgi:hypothetical protein
MAEEQECKEAFLAYHFILSATQPATQAALDREIEQWLRTTFDIRIDFEVDDAVRKLERLGLLRRTGENLTVLPLDDALARIDTLWDGLFDEKGREAAAAGA